MFSRPSFRKSSYPFVSIHFKIMNQNLSIQWLLCGVATLWVLPGCVAGEPHKTIKSATKTTAPIRVEVGSAPLTIDRAVRLALAHNPGLWASDARREAAAGRAVQSREWQNPELEVSAEDIPAGSPRLSQSKNMVGISQTVLYPGKRRLDREIGAADALSGEAGWRLHQAALAREVKIGFYRVLAAEQSAQVSVDLVALAESSAAAAKKRADAGDTALQEQLRAEIQQEQATTELAEAQRQVTEARQAFALLLGVPAMRTAMLAGSPDAADGATDLARIPASWLAAHPAMVTAQAKCRMAQATARRAEVNHLPDPKVGIAGGRNEAADENLLEFRLTLPLPLFDRSKGRIQEARAGVAEAEAELAATQQQLLAEWHSAVTRFEVAAAQVTAHRERMLPKSEEALRLVRTGFEEGKFGFIDLLDTQRMTAEVRLAYQKKLFELNTARAELESFVSPVPVP
jgi:cobalt-zinc-cadmium efflux system outer membrane protein